MNLILKVASGFIQHVYLEMVCFLVKMKLKYHLMYEIIFICFHGFFYYAEYLLDLLGILKLLNIFLEHVNNCVLWLVIFFLGRLFFRLLILALLFFLSFIAYHV
jgi:hypothetical protein